MMALSPAQTATKLNIDLQFVLANLNVPFDLQPAANDGEIKSIKIYGNIGNDRPSGRTNIVEMFGINPMSMGLPQKLDARGSQI